MSNHLAISSSVVLHLSANPFCCGVSGMVISCRMPASKQFILNCFERNSFALSYLSFLNVPTLRTKTFGLASISLLALRKSKKQTSCTGMQTQCGTGTLSDSTLKSPITSEHPLQLLLCFGLCHSWYWSLCDLGQCAHIAYIIDFPHFFWCIPDHIRWIQMTQSSVPLLCTVELHAAGTHLEF